MLQEIALRSKPVTEKYQGLERFFVFDKNEILNLLPSPSVECSYSSTKITAAGKFRYEIRWPVDQPNNFLTHFKKQFILILENTGQFCSMNRIILFSQLKLLILCELPQIYIEGYCQNEREHD